VPPTQPQHSTPTAAHQPHTHPSRLTWGKELKAEEGPALLLARVDLVYDLHPAVLLSDAAAAAWMRVRRRVCVCGGRARGTTVLRLLVLVLQLMCWCAAVAAAAAGGGEELAPAAQQ
jgi:hypothetical protein